MKKTEEKSMEKKGKFVEVEYNGIGAWSIYYPKKGVFTFGPGDKHSFDLTNKYDLRAMLDIIKQINSPTNTSSYVDKKDRAMPHKYRQRFVITSGKENIAPVLLKYNFRINNIITEEEEEAIKELCPDFFKEEKKV